MPSFRSLGAINFGMLDGDDSDSNAYKAVLGIGIITILNAAFNCFVLCTHPAFKVKPPPPRPELTNDVRACPTASSDAVLPPSRQLGCGASLYVTALLRLSS